MEKNYTLWHYRAHIFLI
ncbi:hypothetical protein EMK97_00525 [Litorilituus sediminis]|uniref:Uncharacterized protein n=1 Tax=Litorilituus sediminis TaxID=718192 RepID=A0A4P6P7D5_9GAMM|nr:hypothetical protein EMK97_00525 [Litorilituus sediminis]